MLSCKETSLLVSQSLDRNLSRRERWAVGLHLLICRACTRFKKHMEFLHRAMREYGRRASSEAAQLSAEERAGIQRALERIR